jgi:hypothetical protein
MGHKASLDQGDVMLIQPDDDVGLWIDTRVLARCGGGHVNVFFLVVVGDSHSFGGL